MIVQSTRFAVCLGLLAGSLAIATTARADIPITGGRATGDAAFFSPTATTGGTTPSGAPILFDTAIQTLRLVTPNGTTTTSRFIPTASRFVDTNGNNVPDSGDTGRLEGTLSGVAFSSNGNPVFFQGVPTAINFTLNSFSPALIQGGTLISPQQAGTAPLIFLPVQNVTLSSASSATFTTNQGLLSVGPFAAALTGDSIKLPSDLQLRSTNTSDNIVAILGRRIKFDFEGTDVQPVAAKTNFDPSGGTIAFSGPTTKFQVQSVGTPGTREFQIQGDIANLDLQLSAPFSGTLNGTLSPSAVTSYSVKGEGPGYVALGNNTVAFAGSARRDTQFQFEQSGGTLAGQSSGNVQFALRSGSGDFTNFSPSVGVNNNGTDFTSTASSTSGSSSSTSGSSSSTSSATSPTTIALSTTFVSNTTYIKLFNPSLFVVGQTTDDQENQLGESNVTYTIYQSRRAVEVVVENAPDDQILLVERDRSDRQLPPGLAKHRGRVLSAYQVIGLPSRVFPGLVGLQQIPTDQVQSTTTTNSTTTTTTPNSTTSGTTTTPNTPPPTPTPTPPPPNTTTPTTTP